MSAVKADAEYKRSPIGEVLNLSVLRSSVSYMNHGVARDDTRIGFSYYLDQDTDLNKVKHAVQTAMHAAKKRVRASYSKDVIDGWPSGLVPSITTINSSKVLMELRVEYDDSLYGNIIDAEAEPEKVKKISKIAAILKEEFDLALKSSGIETVPNTSDF